MAGLGMTSRAANTGSLPINRKETVDMMPEWGRSSYSSDRLPPVLGILSGSSASGTIFHAKD